MTAKLTPINLPTPENFRYWLMKSRPGEEFVYHVGDLAFDREYALLSGTRNNVDPVGARKATDPNASFETKKIEAVDAIAREVWKAKDAGYVTLKQRRLAPRYFAYIAQRRVVKLAHAWREAA